MQHSNEVSIIFLKSGWWENSAKFGEKKDICVDKIFVSFTNFKGIQGFYTKFQAISRIQGALNKFKAFQGFQGAVGTLYVIHQNIIHVNVSHMGLYLLV